MSRGFGYVPDSVSAVVVCFNRLDLTQRCVQTTLDSDDLPDELVFVDNCSVDGTGGWLATLDCGIPTEVATLSQNVGWGRGANIGSQLAEGEYLLHLNNDTEVTKDWLTPLVEAMDDKTAVVAGKLLNPDGSVQHQGITLYTDTNGTLVAENMREPGPIEALSLAAALVRADAWNQLGGIDPLFRNGYEDVDFCLRARREGWGLKYVPESVVMHHGSASGPERWTHVQDNIRTLNERWSGVTV
jgi:O-antigen biosynthesis protein